MVDAKKWTKSCQLIWKKKLITNGWGVQGVSPMQVAVNLKKTENLNKLHQPKDNYEDTEKTQLRRKRKLQRQRQRPLKRD